jgi:predicted nucleic-acid-binding Zn-ribbon protein
MKKTGSCPKCGCTRLYVIPKVAQGEHDADNRVRELCVTAVAVPRALVPGAKSPNSYRSEIGHLEMWVCSACNLAEWYAINVNQEFDALVGLGLAQLVEKPQAGPFR